MEILDHSRTTKSLAEKLEVQRWLGPERSVPDHRSVLQSAGEERWGNRLTVAGRLDQTRHC